VYARASMRRALPLLLAAACVPASVAEAAEPIMPLAEVHAGMRCTALSVVRGTDVAAFDVEVLDVVDDRSGGGPRILVRGSGPAIDGTGMGPGFSGSPILCPDAAGVARTIGAVSEAIGEYGGKVVLATPIEAILGTPVAAPQARTARALLARARPLVAPVTVSGLGTRLGIALQTAAAARGRAVLATPAGPAGAFPPQRLRPGAAFGVGYASGDIGASAIGTVTYVDGDRVWGFGHPLDGAGARSLLLQDVYVFRVINNPLALADISGTYKLAAPGHDLGTLTDDGLSAVVGRTGALPATIPVRVWAKDLDSGATTSVVTDVADESAVDEPIGGSILGWIAPVAVLQAAGTVLGGSPARLTGRACFVIALRERADPARFCNRYVTDAQDPTGAGNVIAAAAAGDLSRALAIVDAYKASPVHVERVEATLRISRGRDQAYLRKVRLPRRAEAGSRVPATLTLRHLRGRLERRRVTLRLPHDLRRGRQRVLFTGADVDAPEGDLSDLIVIDFGYGETGGEFGPAGLGALRSAIEGVARFDGIRAGRPPRRPDARARGERSYRAGDLRISGRALATVRITRRG
jgi:hypothetical protein